MRILMRADAGERSGTGHVMRCLTLAEVLIARRHEVVLRGSLGEIAWLRDYVDGSGVDFHECAPDDLGSGSGELTEFDRAVVDSYRIPAEQISELATRVPTLALVDGDIRGIRATILLDQNLGAESPDQPPEGSTRFLAGSRFALIRRAILEQRRKNPWEVAGRRPRVTVFMGGSDPFGAIAVAAQSVASLDAELTIIVSPRWRSDVEMALLNRPDATVADPTPRLPELLGWADIIVSAAGTSAWDVCAMGRPAVLTAVVDNQRESLQQATTRRLALGIDAIEAIGELRGIGESVGRLMGDELLRRELSANSLAAFDGLGAERVAGALEGAGETLDGL
jgi:spore coat polysaccharide biosynthesis predicted glycosyltransferase SpsG